MILANLQSNKRHKKETLRHESFSYVLAFLINHLKWRAKKCRFIWSSDQPEPELRDRCSWEKLVTFSDFKRHPKQKNGSAERFFDDFRDEMMDYKGKLRFSVLAFWQGEIFDLKAVKYLDESKSLQTHWVIYLPLFIDKSSIKLTDTCVVHLLRM